MENKSSNIWKIISIISIIICIILLGYILMTSIKRKPKKIENISEVTNGTEIRIIERLLKDGHVEGLKNVRWTDSTIRQEYNYMSLEIRLTNESETEKVEAKTITANLYDSEGNLMASQDTQMDEIAENFGFTTIYFNFDITDNNLVYDIELKCK